MANCISVRGLEMSFSGCDALQGVDLVVPQGSVFALLGENGAGKTTLIRILTGFQQPSAGSVEICGLNPQTDSIEVRKRIGYVSDQPALYDWMRVDEIGWFTAAFYPDGFLDRYSESLSHFDLPRSRKIRNLSKGQRAKVALALALAPDPELLILDEPTSGLDPHVRREFMESMVERAVTGRTVLLSSHQIAEVERVADQVAILHQGKVRLNDSMTSIKANFCELLINLQDPLITLPQLDAGASVLSEQTSGRQRRMMVRGFSEEMAKTLEARPGVLSMRSRKVSLEEVFIATTRGLKWETGNQVNSTSSDIPVSPATSLELLTGGDHES